MQDFVGGFLCWQELLNKAPKAMRGARAMTTKNCTTRNVKQDAQTAYSASVRQWKGQAGVCPTRTPLGPLWIVRSDAGIAAPSGALDPQVALDLLRHELLLLKVPAKGPRSAVLPEPPLGFPFG